MERLLISPWDVPANVTVCSIILYKLLCIFYLGLYLGLGRYTDTVYCLAENEFVWY